MEQLMTWSNASFGSVRLISVQPIKTVFLTNARELAHAVVISGKLLRRLAPRVEPVYILGIKSYCKQLGLTISFVTVRSFAKAHSMAMAIMIEWDAKRRKA